MRVKIICVFQGVENFRGSRDKRWPRTSGRNSGMDTSSTVYGVRRGIHMGLGEEGGSLVDSA